MRTDQQLAARYQVKDSVPVRYASMYLRVPIGRKQDQSHYAGLQMAKGHADNKGRW